MTAMYMKGLKGRHFWKHSNNVVKSVTYMLLLLRDGMREGGRDRERECVSMCIPRVEDRAHTLRQMLCSEFYPHQPEKEYFRINELETYFI